MEWVPVGKVTKPHGLKGELKFHPLVSDPGILGDFKRARLCGDSGVETELRVESIRGSGTRLIIKFEGLDSIEDVKPLAGRSLFTHRDDFQRLPEGEYYWFEIEGLEVFDEDKRYYGRVEEIIATGSNDVYVVRKGSKELLLPMIDSVVKSIDLKERKLIFHPVEGLLEDTPV